MPLPGIHPEPAYLTNRAASYMAMKRFRPALDDCQQAAFVQSSSPQPKTLIRLARCHLALGSPVPALNTLRTALSIDPKNTSALQLQKQIIELEAHLRNFEMARGKKEWGMARLALDKCFQGIEGEGGETPVEWRLWRVELDMARGNWDSAAMTAKYESP
jgi:DnaJ homolog subfamily C member 7